MYLLRQRHEASWQENFHLLLVLAYHLALILTMIGKQPTLYARYRTPIYAVVRPLGYLSPSVRNTRHAAAQLLAQPASPGLLGMLADLKRLMLASRVTGTAVIGVVVAADPAVALPVQAICSYLAAANSGDPLTQGRVAGFSSLMDLLALPFSALVPLPQGEADAATAARQCAGLLFYLQVMVGVLLPVYVVVRSMRQPNLPALPPPAALSGWERLRHSAAQAYATTNLAVWRAFRLLQDGPLPPGVLIWMLVAFTWTLTLAVHGL
ncbi:hypothetical protein COHA_002476 [Chlorella ohadii]|uniref:Uncharacterized protein n=1 Tax=Chlorella ohadii TaxID=2649997 RepID=A0AAD5DWN6_9CHLO|nr:hypothetical protein COHA_002476 [Chlorella ohadii]